jgi:hypothetical protein
MCCHNDSMDGYQGLLTSSLTKRLNLKQATGTCTGNKAKNIFHHPAIRFFTSLMKLYESLINHSYFIRVKGNMIISKGVMDILL